MITNPLGFYLGVPEVAWLARSTVPMCVSYGRLRRVKGRLPESPYNGHWMLDSRGFRELQDHGRWTITPAEYVAAVHRADNEIGNLGWASTQDWMCEAEIIHGGVFGRERFAGTRQFIDPDHQMSDDQLVLEHQRRTVANFVELRDRWADLPTTADCPFMPTLQGYRIDEYHRCWDMYEAAGVRISEHYPIVALGSICRRQDTAEIARIFRSLRARDPGLPLHGFGVKQGGLEREDWNTADSQAWSTNARWGPKDPTCTADHQTCASCMTYALNWREALLAKVHTPNPQPDAQLDLFTELEEAA